MNTGDGVLIGGFVVAGGAREVVVVARGPSLAAAGVAPVLADPKLQLLRGQTVIAENDNWKTNSQSPALAQLSFLGALQDTESVISVVLEPGAYTAIVSGASGGDSDRARRDLRDRLGVGPGEFDSPGLASRARRRKAGREQSRRRRRISSGRLGRDRHTMDLTNHARRKMSPTSKAAPETPNRM